MKKESVRIEYVPGQVVTDPEGHTWLSLKWNDVSSDRAYAVRAVAQLNQTYQTQYQLYKITRHTIIESAEREDDGKPENS